jgi:hypothetical protein
LKCDREYIVVGRVSKKLSELSGVSKEVSIWEMGW